MATDRQHQITQLFQAALEHDPAEREEFLRRACAGDDTLRREVESLLRYDDAAAPFLERPAAEEFAGLVRSSDPTRSIVFEPGDELGPYKIQALLGVGGMGQVYRGRDTRLGRDVALKVIAPRQFGEPERRRRFELEARAASALNHPGIVTIYDIGETGGVAWIAMEWVEGRTLRQLVSEGALPVPDAWAIARQIAEGLAAAHAKGIVHRDLKPENVMIAPGGRAKILDFGLARQTVVDRLESSIAETVEAGGGATVEGTILGTVGYMSPEQAAGRPADFRSDQFSFGLLVYEMLTGRRAFAKDTAVETLSAVLREDPVPLSAIRPGIPERFQRIVARCLAKLPAERFPSTNDLAAALQPHGSDVALEHDDEVRRAPADETIAVPRTGSTRSMVRRSLVGVGAAVVIALAVWGWAMWSASPPAIDSLAVLPFDVAGTDATAAYLAEGLSDSLIDQLSAAPSLKVMARGTVFQYKGVADPREAGRKLGVRAVLSGTVARHGNELAITAELIDTATGARLWGNKFERKMGDLVRVQEQIAGEIAGGLRLRLSVDERRAVTQYATKNAEAYELFLKGRFLLANDTEDDDLEARSFFEKAIAKDPGFVDAHLGVAATYIRSAGRGALAPAKARPRAEAEERLVLKIDPTNVVARTGLAASHFLFDWEWTETEREFEQLKNEPRLLLGPQFHPIAMFFWARGRPEEAVALVKRALEVDPANLEVRIMLADFLVHAGHLDEAAESYKSIAEAEPADPSPLIGLAEVFRRRGDVKSAIETLRKAYEASGEQIGVSALASARTEADYRNAEIAVARARLDDLTTMATQRYVSPLDFARLYAQTGQTEKAFASLDAALVERSVALVFLKVDPTWDRIRTDPRFAAIVRRVGIP